MQHQTHSVDRVVLIGEKGSALADRIAADLEAKGPGLGMSDEANNPITFVRYDGPWYAGP